MIADSKHLQHQKTSDDDDAYDLEGPEGKGSKSWVPAIEDPNYFEVLHPEEIYDSFFSIKRMGFIANRIIRKLNETKHIVTSKILEKRKKLRLSQRKQFETLSPAGVEYLKVLLKMEVAALKNQTDSSLNPSPSVKCRLAHLALDINTSNILSRIYDTDANAAATIGIQTLELWKVLALDYVNNPMWQPRRAVNDDHLLDIDPARAPDDKFTPESLRSVFSRLRIDYTRALLKFTAGVKLTVPVPRETLDLEFWERYAKHDKALFYLYHLFRDRPMQDCLLVDAALMRSDNHHLDIIDNGPSAIGNKRGHADMMDTHHHHHQGGGMMEGEEDPLALMEAEQAGPNSLLMQGLTAGSMAKRLRDESGGMTGTGGGTDEHSWQAGVRKDRAISNYYKRLTINNDIKFYLDLSNRELVGEAIKRNAKTKMNALLMKKIEDRYDDLNF